MVASKPDWMSGRNGHLSHAAGAGGMPAVRMPGVVSCRAVHVCVGACTSRADLACHAVPDKMLDKVTLFFFHVRSSIHINHDIIRLEALGRAASVTNTDYYGVCTTVYYQPFVS